MHWSSLASVNTFMGGSLSLSHCVYCTAESVLLNPPPFLAEIVASGSMYSIAGNHLYYDLHCISNLRQTLVFPDDV